MIETKNNTVIFVRSSGIYDDSRSTKELQCIAKMGCAVLVLCWDRYGNAKEKNANVFSLMPNIEFVYYNQPALSGIGSYTDG